MNPWYRLLVGMLGTYVRIFIREIVVMGENNLISGAKIIVGNHPNATDGFVLPLIIREHLHFAVMADLFTFPFIGLVFRKSEQIPVVPGEGRKFIQQAMDWLSKEKPVVIFPEGQLNLNAGLRKARTGASVLALKSGVPILPVGFHVPEQFIKVINSRAYGRRTTGGWQFGGKIFVNFGKAFTLDADDDPENISKATLQRCTAEIMSRIEELANEARHFAQETMQKQIQSV